jgi:hypothetical protein
MARDDSMTSVFLVTALATIPPERRTSRAWHEVHVKKQLTCSIVRTAESFDLTEHGNRPSGSV